MRRVLRLMFMPWQAARVALKPDFRLAPPDRTIERLRLMRTLVGVVIVAWVAVKYEELDTSRIVEQATVHLMVSVLVAVLAVPVCVLGLVLTTGRTDRRATRRCMRRPMGAMGAFIGAGAVTAAAATVLTQAQDIHGPVMITVMVLVWIAVVWGGIFTAVATFLVPRHLFAAADGHLLMPSLLAPVLAWSVALVDVASPEGETRVPQIVAVVVTLGAPVTITVMSVWEFVRVRQMYGVTLAGGGRPTRYPAPAPPPAPRWNAGQSPGPGGPVAPAWGGAAFPGGMPGPAPGGAPAWGAPAWGAPHSWAPPPRFNHVPHAVGSLLCLLWVPAWIGMYLRWKSAQQRAGMYR